MPAIFINPTTEEHLNLLNRLKEQNQDLRVFISDKIEKDFVEKLPGKKAIGDIYDDSHIYTASEGAFCGIFYEGSENSLREVFIKSIKQSSLKRILWISYIKVSDEITEAAHSALRIHDEMHGYKILKKGTDQHVKK